jgi:hypothetical protein
VICQHKETTKLSVVFDGSARPSKDDLSLNDCLQKGPNLVLHLFDTVVNFRGYPIGLVADIEKAFHQIQIAPDDRKMLKFLWFEDISQDPPTLKEYEFRRLPFGLTPSPAILSSTISHHLSRYKEIEPEIVYNKHTCRFGESGIGCTSGGWKFPELTERTSRTHRTCKYVWFLSHAISVKY